MASIFGTNLDDLLVGIPGEDDIIRGYNGNDTLNGLDGDDTLIGNRGDDTLDGGDGADTLWGGRDADLLQGGAGSDVLEGGFGADRLAGGEDDGYFRGGPSPVDNRWGDTAAYVRSDAGVTVNLATGTARGGHAEGDTLTGIESVRGSHHDDFLVARNDDPSTEDRQPEGSVLFGMKGNDLLHGGSGNDFLWGGKGDDSLVGGAGWDYLEGGFGADEIDGGEHPEDGWGDFAGYAHSNAGVTVNLARGTGQGGHAAGDTLTGIENVWGSRHADWLTGDDAENALYGGGGHDTLAGGHGDDLLDGGAGADAIDGGEGSFDYALYDNSDTGVTVNLTTGIGRGGDADGDTLAGIEGVRGSQHADWLTGDDAEINVLLGGEGNDILEGGEGSDILQGGEGFDIASYLDSDAGVTVDLATGTAADGHGSSDVLWGIEDVWGSSHADHLTGDDTANKLYGGDGNDTLEGGRGADLLDGGASRGDLADYKLSDAGVTVNLATGMARGGHAEGDTLTGIEDVGGSEHADHLIGDDETDSRIHVNLLLGRDGDDTLEGGEGADFLEGGAGADVVDGGDGSDWATYRDSDAGVTVDLATGIARGGHAEGDTLAGIVNIWGSAHADHLTGDDADNHLVGVDGGDILEGGEGLDTLSGGAGADELDGGEGADVLRGGEGRDIALYWHSDAGVTVNLATGVGHGGDAEGDTLSGMEMVRGSYYADHLTGDDADNLLDGLGGDDTLEGGEGDDLLFGADGADTIDGGGGSDSVLYWHSDPGVTVNLATGIGQGGLAEGDRLTGIEHVAGSSRADHLTGDDARNQLWGWDGDDTLEGGEGDDLLFGYAGADVIDGGEGRDSIDYSHSDARVVVNLAWGVGYGGHAEGDTLTGIEIVHGSPHDDWLIGDDAANQLYGWGGDDTLDGGPGNDTLEGGEGRDILDGGAGADVLDGGEGDLDQASYEYSDTGVTVNLTTGTAQRGHAAGDTLTRVEQVVGSSHADHLTGNDTSNALDGGDGNDSLKGGDGNDVLYGGDGADVLDGGEGHDRLEGGAGADVIAGGGGMNGAWYLNSDAGVTVSLETGIGKGGHAEGDTLTGINQLFGSSHADHLIGDDAGNWLYGLEGDDTLDGGEGSDSLYGGPGNDTFVFGGGDTVDSFGLDGDNDRIDISDLDHINANNFEANVTIRQSGNDVEVQIGNAVMTLGGVSAADVTVDDFILA